MVMKVLGRGSAENSNYSPSVCDNFTPLQKQGMRNGTNRKKTEQIRVILSGNPKSGALISVDSKLRDSADRNKGQRKGATSKNVQSDSRQKVPKRQKSSKSAKTSFSIFRRFSRRAKSVKNISESVKNEISGPFYGDKPPCQRLCQHSSQRWFWAALASADFTRKVSSRGTRVLFALV